MWPPPARRRRPWRRAPHEHRLHRRPHDPVRDVALHAGEHRRLRALGVGRPLVPSHRRRGRPLRRVLGGLTGEWTGALAGGAAFVLLSAWALGSPRPLLSTGAVFIVAHAAGYFAGGGVYEAGVLDRKSTRLN